MDPKLLEQAREIVGTDQILVNIVSKRVRQLGASSRPMVETEPGMGYIDIALKEIAEGKLGHRPAATPSA